MASRQKDPTNLEELDGIVEELHTQGEEIRLKPHQRSYRVELVYNVSDRVLRGREEIAAFLRTSPRTVERWQRECALPAWHPGGSSPIMTTVELLRRWIVCLQMIDVEKGRPPQRRRKKGEADTHWGPDTPQPETEK